MARTKQQQGAVERMRRVAKRYGQPAPVFADANEKVYALTRHTYPDGTSTVQRVVLGRSGGYDWTGPVSEEYARQQGMKLP